MGCISSKRARTRFRYAAQPNVVYVTARPTQSSGGQPSESERKSEDNFDNIDEVTTALAHSGLETANLIVGIDFTRTNKWAGAMSFHGRSLHHIGDELNPYEQAISIIGRTLSGFLDKNLVPCFGFGDDSTLDRDVFSFYPDKRICNGFEEVLTPYDIFASLMCQGQHHLLPSLKWPSLLLNVTGEVDAWGKSPQIKETIDAIVKARKYPLSIIVVGVGDGPWDMMKNFLNDYNVRESYKFQFVNFTEIMKKNMDISRKEAAFAVAALSGIPSQYIAALELRIWLSCPCLAVSAQVNLISMDIMSSLGHVSLQVLLQMTMFAESASLIQRIWCLVADIRLAAIVGKIFSYIPLLKHHPNPNKTLFRCYLMLRRHCSSHLVLCTYFHFLIHV
ncbi:E3 ubiquitin-protein ligase RGLG5 [Camellia lanceoleosa]|uniref:E3 ubiquitin-protein ligase RGLG5 n=1 Tax=Camellia lanceoleosa TaxID=1840588 RepID=A0ACC0I1N7_9ERIC|nr:E3 ubiquitin-protein ligase RGLG5 [Camellia lanceoleosa]